VFILINLKGVFHIGSYAFREYLGRICLLKVPPRVIILTRLIGLFILQ